MATSAQGTNRRSDGRTDSGDDQARDADRENGWGIAMPDKLEIKQVPRHIVQAFTGRYGKVGQPMEEWQWLDLFMAWHAGWLEGARFEREIDECSIDTTQ